MLRELYTRDEIREIVGEADMFARCELGDRLVGWSWGSAVATVRRANYRRTESLALWGPKHQVSALLGALNELGAFRIGLRDTLPKAVIVPRDMFDVVTTRLGPQESMDWDFMATTRTPLYPELPPGFGLVELDDAADAMELKLFASREYPQSEGAPGMGIAKRWIGVRGPDGSLAACGALHQLASGLPNLAGVAVTAHLRGRHLGKFISAVLTAGAVRQHGVCALGIYASNDVARRTYESIGYVTDKRWSWAAIPSE